MSDKSITMARFGKRIAWVFQKVWNGTYLADKYFVVFLHVTFL